MAPLGDPGGASRWLCTTRRTRNEQAAPPSFNIQEPLERSSAASIVSAAPRIASQPVLLTR
jgi:hypothetical protein